MIHHVVEIDAAPDKLWKALTDGDGLAGWWSTKVDAEPAKIGAHIHFSFEADFNPVMEIAGMEPGRELVWRCVGGHEPWADGTFRFSLVDLDGGRCRLRFWQEYAVELDDDAYGVYNFNWGYYLESLRLFCDKGKGKPYHAPGD